ncbi:putative F-box protein At5g04010 [Silene latifolia]|uniref:putative F-box protein At5g04010 n=1 Tax=Silene latifolia TaxID=37657 RepID=UPI003D771D63
MSSINDNNINNNNVCASAPPPWQVLALVSYHLDPKTLAIASCVSKSWFSCFSHDDLWDPLCSSHFPSLSTLHAAANNVVSHRRLYAIGYAAARLRNPMPRKPNLSLAHLLFAITIRVPSCGHVISIVRPCMELKRDPHGTFRFEVDLDEGREWSVGELEGVTVTWNVVDTAWRAVAVMAEESGLKKGGFSSCADGWFSEELPTPWCCSGAMSSGLVADLRLETKAVMTTTHDGGGWNKLRIEKVKVGIMCIVNWRYLSVDDALSYLDHFLHV